MRYMQVGKAFIASFLRKKKQAKDTKDTAQMFQCFWFNKKQELVH